MRLGTVRIPKAVAANKTQIPLFKPCPRCDAPAARHRPYCSKCQTEMTRRWRKRNPEKCKAYGLRHKEERRKYYRSWYATNGRKRHPGSYVAMRKVQAALKEGSLIRPDRCQLCGSTGRLAGHHEDYSRPLTVLWVCYSCHRQIHANEQSN